MHRAPMLIKGLLGGRDTHVFETRVACRFGLLSMRWPLACARDKVMDTSIGTIVHTFVHCSGGLYGPIRPIGVVTVRSLQAAPASPRMVAKQ
jgi:hypothetical protein